jgi:molecular chaperone IbpA
VKTETSHAALRAARLYQFKRQFTLADHVEVRGARFENGLLIIELQREIPEAMKPRRIAINGASPGKVSQIESKAA